MTTKPLPPHPMQPLVRDKNGVIRFRENRIVAYLVVEASAGRKCDLNALAVRFYDDQYAEDREQFAQLIGYSLAGFGELSYVRDETYEKAEAAAADVDR